MKKIVSFFQLIRWPNIVLLAVCQLFGFLILKYNYQFSIDYKTIFLVITTCFSASAGYIINDFFDTKIDFINKPSHLIFVDTVFKRREILVIYYFFVFISQLFASFISIKIFIIVLIINSLLWIYSYQLKTRFLVGNLLVAFLAATSVYFPALLYAKTNRLLFIYALFAFFTHFLREIIKDIEDSKGDLAVNAKTIPLVLGKRNTKNLVLSLILVFGFFNMVLYFYAGFEVIKYLCLIINLYLAYVYFRLYKADTQKDFNIISTHFKLILSIGILSMPFGVLG